ncbi:MAG: ERF family protein [Blastocatellales bacterium]
MSQEIVEAQPQAVAPVETFNVEALISKAIEQGAPIDTMERILAMRRELKAEFAKEAFDKAMAKFQSECPVIVKNKEVKTDSGAVAYRYAPIESIIEQVKTPLQANGFSYSTNMELLETGVRVSVKVTHTAGHSEQTQMTVPLGNKTRIMSDTQVVAAAQTYAKRYAFCNAFGILTGDEDNDGQDMGQHSQLPAGKPQANKASISDPQRKTIWKLMQQKGYTEADLIDEGFPPLKQLTGGRGGTASELIDWLIKAKTNGQQRPRDIQQEPELPTIQVEEEPNPELAEIARQIPF